VITSTRSRLCKAVGYISCHLVKTGDMYSSMMLLAASGLLDEIHNPSAYEAIVSVSEAPCSNASDTTSVDDRSMKSVILANSLLNEHALVFCPASLLPFMTFLSNLVDVAGHMILKSECGVGEKMEAYKHGLLEKSRCRRKPLSCPITHSSVENGDINKCAISLHPSFDSAEKEKDPKAYIFSLVFDLIRCGSKVIVDASTVQLLASPVPLLNCGRRRTCRNCHQRGIIPDSDAEGKI
jgi:hypothetical protein